MPADLSWRRAVRKEPLTRFVIGGSTMESPRPRLDMAYMLMLVVDIAIVIAILPAWGIRVQRPHVRHVVVADHRVARRRVAHAFQHADALAGMRHVGIASRAALHYYWLPPAYLFPIATIILGVMATRRPRPAAI